MVAENPVGNGIGPARLPGRRRARGRGPGVPAQGAVATGRSQGRLGAEAGQTEGGPGTGLPGLSAPGSPLAAPGGLPAPIPPVLPRASAANATPTARGAGTGVASPWRGCWPGETFTLKTKRARPRRPPAPAGGKERGFAVFI